jgi:hypothetical protein
MFNGFRGCGGPILPGKVFNLNFRRSHPSFVQIYATASAFGIHAAVFHDGPCSILRNARSDYPS